MRIVKILAIIAMGVFIPYWRGWTTIDPFFLLPFACFSALLVAPLLEKQSGPPLQRVKQAVLQACAILLGIIAIAMGAVNVIMWTGQLILPELSTVLAAIALCVTAATATAAALSLLGRRLSPKAVKWTFRLAMAALVLLYRNAPLEWSIAWSGFVYDWGIAPFAFACAALFTATAAGCIALLVRQSAMRPEQAV